jgi:glucosylceramidase
MMALGLKTPIQDNSRSMNKKAAALAVAYISTAHSLFDKRPLTDAGSGPPDVSVYPDAVRQTIEGFGGAFNEKGGQALSVLDEAQRREVMRRLFDPVEGLGFSVCRVPIGSSDYALDRYTLNETAGDSEMKHFSIERDRGCLIPYIKEAMSIQPRLRLWASAWTPPTWMKNNRAFDSGAFLDDPKVYRAYALYLLKFIRAYGAEGIPFEVVAVQNEPGTLTDYPSCDWTAVQYLTFIRDYLGPLFQAEGLDDAIMLGTLNQPKLASHAFTVLGDPRARQYVALAGMQWYSFSFMGQLKAVAPGLTVWQTETDCGNWPRLVGYDPDKPQNDIAYASFTWEKIRDWLKAGVTVYELWNMVLDPWGKNIGSRRAWPQNSPITVHPETREVRYTPMFGAVGSFAKFVRPGSRMVETEGTFANALAFTDPDGRVVVVLHNHNTTREDIRIWIRGAVYLVEMPPQSFTTVVTSGT